MTVNKCLIFYLIQLLYLPRRLSRYKPLLTINIMKNIVLLLLATCTLLSCNKNKDFEELNSLLEGSWILQEITGGIAGTGYDAPFDRLQINNKEEYSLMIHDAVIQEGTYTLNQANDQIQILFAPNVMDSLFFKDHEKTILLTDQDNTLTLSDPCCDLYVYVFEREE